jgi:hypothetical protein
MMVAFSQNQLGYDQINVMARNQTQFIHQRQQKEYEEQSTLIRQSTARVVAVAAQEELIKEALVAKESLLAQMTSPSGKGESHSQIQQLRLQLEEVSAELLEEKKRSLELYIELEMDHYYRRLSILFFWSQFHFFH